MPVDQLLGDAVHHVVHGEAAPLGFDLGMKGHLHQHVAQFLAHALRIVPVQSVQGLVGFLQEIAADGTVSLLSVPRAAARSPQQSHDTQEIRPVIARLTLKIYHIYSAFARKFVSFYPENGTFFISDGAMRPILRHAEWTAGPRHAEFAGQRPKWRTPPRRRRCR